MNDRIVRARNAVATLHERASLVADLVLGPARPRPDAWQDVVAAVSDRADEQTLWLLAAGTSGMLPYVDEVEKLQRLADQRDFAEIGVRIATRFQRAANENATVRIIDRAPIVLVDGTSPFDSDLSREAASAVSARWAETHGALEVHWNGAGTGFTALDIDLDEDAARDEILIPWRCVVLTVDPSSLPTRAARLQSLGHFFPDGAASIGFGIGPLTSPESFSRHLARWQDSNEHRFSWRLAAQREVGHLVTVSAAAEGEYAGWRGMLAGLGVPGPRIDVIPLPVVTAPPLVGRSAGPTAIGVLYESDSLDELDATLAGLALLEATTPLTAIACGPQENGPQHGARIADEFIPIHWDHSTSIAERVSALAGCSVVVQIARYCVLSPVLDALRASGIPVVRTDVGYLRESGRSGDEVVHHVAPDEIAASVGRALGRRSAASEAPSRTWQEFADELWVSVVSAED